jgi:acyl-CoA synthetase (AMP-forming)/AMP-acid ligase II
VPGNPPSTQGRFDAAGEIAASIVDAIATFARCSPENLAIVAPGRASLSYRLLLAQVDSTLQSLAVAGIDIHSCRRVAVALPQSPELAVALLSLMSVCQCTWLDPEANLAIQQKTLDDFGIDVVVCSDSRELPIVHAARASGCRVLRVGTEPAAPAGTFSLRAESGGRAGDRARAHASAPGVLFRTSGTTSRPKIVPHTDKRLLDQARGYAEWFQLSPSDRSLSIVPFFTNGGLVNGLLAPLLTGGGVACVAEFRSAEFVAWLAELAPTYLYAGPTALSAALDALRSTPVRALWRLRFVRSGAAALPPTLQRELESLLGVPVIQGYGMTETGVITQNPLPPGERRAGSVGIPAGSNVSIQTSEGRAADRGEVGEIVVAGPTITTGYENNPEVNSQTFVAGWFHTGDFGFMDQDGYLYLKGRIKELINRGGQKVSPSDVDEILMGHPAVREAATFPVPHPTLGEDIMAAVIPRAGANAVPDEIRDHCVDHLEPFKVPSRVIFVNSLPRNNTGKVNRAELAAQFPRSGGTNPVPPGNHVEEVICRAFAACLKVSAVGVNDNFFELGGDSILAIQAINIIVATLGCDVTQDAVFRAPSAAALSARILAGGPVARSMGATPSISAVPPIPTRRRSR